MCMYSCGFRYRQKQLYTSLDSQTVEIGVYVNRSFQRLMYPLG